MHKGTLLLTLNMFSATGGIEKVSRVVGKALQDIATEQLGEPVSVFSMYDKQGDVDERYFPAAVFSGFGENKWWFVYEAVRKGVNSRQVILSHSNLLLAGFLIKTFSPKTELILLAHGIEVWSPFSFFKKRMLSKCSRVLAVSQFTKNKMVAVQKLANHKVSILNNCLNPYLELPTNTGKEKTLLQRYGFSGQDKVLMTLTRLSSKEQYKGYDNVLYAIKMLTKEFPSIKYLLVGKYDAAERERLDAIIAGLGLQHQIVFTGFIADAELAAHYSIADLYIMPSKKEGFGLVFIEAMFYGKPVIAGNRDGSVDALGNGDFGLLVNPNEVVEIAAAINQVFENQQAYIPNREKVLNRFGYKEYKDNWTKILNN
jgi:glycosyltransferase involved in cell wall biosynthesis